MYAKIEKDLRLMIELLKKDDSGWTQLFKKALIEFESDKYQLCASTILSGSGGMGSLNDLVLGQAVDEKGNFQWKTGYNEMNNSYQELLTSLYAFAQDIQRTTKKPK
ncbi:MAG: DUF6966 domain-containing protein [Cellvibrionaceae bacterium]